MKKIFRENLSVIICIISILIVAGLGSLFVNLGMEWFSQLSRPTQWVPNIVIPIVWTIIYLLFAIVLSILYKNKIVDNTTTVLCISNGILNLLWCLTFFTFNLLLIGNLIIIINTFMATVLLINLTKQKLWFVNLLWLYPIWLYIATSLNLALWILN